MEAKTPIGRKKIGVIAFSAAALGLLLFFYSLSDSVPPLDALSRVSGNLYSFEETRSGSRNSSKTPRFRLSGSDYLFQYVSIGGDFGAVSSALENATGKTVEVYTDAGNPFRPPFEDIELYTAYSVTIEGEAIREYDDVVASWRSNSKLGVFFGVFLAVAGTSIGLVSFRSNRRAV